MKINGVVLGISFLIGFIAIAYYVLQPVTIQRKSQHKKAIFYNSKFQNQIRLQPLFQQLQIEDGYKMLSQPIIKWNSNFFNFFFPTLDEKHIQPLRNHNYTYDLSLLLQLLKQTECSYENIDPVIIPSLQFPTPHHLSCNITVGWFTQLLQTISITELNTSEWNDLILQFHLLFSKPFYSSYTQQLISFGKFRSKEFDLKSRMPFVLDSFLIPKFIFIIFQRLISMMKQQLDPIYIASMTHFSLLKVFPFEYNNGAIAKLVSNVILLQFRLAPFSIWDNQLYQKVRTNPLALYQYYLKNNERMHQLLNNEEESTLQTSVVLQQVEQFVSSHDYGEILFLLRRVLQEEPENHKAWEMYSIPLMHRGNLKQARIALEKSNHTTALEQFDKKMVQSMQNNSSLTLIPHLSESLHMFIKSNSPIQTVEYQFIELFSPQFHSNYSIFEHFYPFQKPKDKWNTLYLKVERENVTQIWENIAKDTIGNRLGYFARVSTLLHSLICQKQQPNDIYLIIIGCKKEVDCLMIESKLKMQVTTPLQRRKEKEWINQAKNCLL